jgi:hypothetical protein
MRLPRAEGISVARKTPENYILSGYRKSAANCSIKGFQIPGACLRCGYVSGSALRRPRQEQRGSTLLARLAQVATGYEPL